MTTETTASAPERGPRSGPAIKLAWLVGLALATIVPTSMIFGLVTERMNRQDEARAGIAHGWGPEQTIGRFGLAMPAQWPDGTPRYVLLAPNTLDMKVEIAPERRRRGFFAATVYSAAVHVSGTFRIPKTIRFKADAKPFPERGFLLASLAGLNGADSGDTAGISGTRTPWQVFEETAPGCGPAAGTLSVPVTLVSGQEVVPFEADLHLRGTEVLRFPRVAKEMNVSVKGAWPSPGFLGDEPPVYASIGPTGFEGRWHVDSLGTATASIVGCAATQAPSTFGVELVQAMPIYRMVLRAAKYGPLFIVLAFAVYYVFELLAGIRITVLQYALMAASLSLFPLLLVATGEVSGYTWGYVVSAALVVAQASVFTASVVRRIAPALGFAALLSALFGFLYVLLGLETLALLTGAIALFLVLSVVMVVTQRVYHRGETAFG